MSEKIPIRITFWKPEYVLPKFLIGKAKWEDVDFLDNAIDWHTILWNEMAALCSLNLSKAKILTKLRAAHAEIWTPDSLGQFIEPQSQKMVGFSWTSTMRPPVNGVVCRPAEMVYNHLNRWYFWQCQITKERFENLKIWMQFKAATNEGYGLAEIASFFLPWRIDSKRFICSEFCQKALARIDLFEKEKIWSPLLLSYHLYLLAQKSPSTVNGPYGLTKELGKESVMRMLE